MLNLLLVALFAAVAGDPVEVADNTVTAPAQVEAAAPEAQPAEPVQEADAGAAATEVSNRSQRRCRNELITGTRLPQRVCTTRSEDAVIRDDAREICVALSR